MDIDSVLKDIIVQNVTFLLQSEDIQEQTDLINDLGLDSISIVNLLADLEEEFRIDIQVQELTTPVLNRYQWLKEYITEKSKQSVAGREMGL